MKYRIMNREERIEEVMTRDVYFLHPDDHLQRADDMFRMYGIHHIPVVDKKSKLLGILSKSDILPINASLSLFNEEKRREINRKVFEKILVEEVMVHQVARLRPDDSLMTAAAFFRENLFHAIPIVDEADRLVGILTPYDLINYCFHEPLAIAHS